MTEMATGDHEAKFIGDAVSTTIRVSEQDGMEASEKQGHLTAAEQSFLDSLSA